MVPRAAWTGADGNVGVPTFVRFGTSKFFRSPLTGSTSHVRPSDPLACYGPFQSLSDRYRTRLLPLHQICKCNAVLPGQIQAPCGRLDDFDEAPSGGWDRRLLPIDDGDR